MDARFLRLPRSFLPLFAVVSFMFALYLYGSTEVKLVIDIDGVSKKVATNNLKVRGVLMESGVEIDDEDVVRPDVDEFHSGGPIVVRTAKQVTLRYNQIKEKITVNAIDTRSALYEVGFTDEQLKGLSFNNKTLKDNSMVALSSYRTSIVKEVFYFDESGKEYPEPKYAKGLGIKEKVLKKEYLGNVLLSSSVISESILKKPYVARRKVALVNRGSPRQPSLSQSSEIIHNGRALNVIATAYAPGAGAGFITATGVRAKRGIIAVDPKVIPLGTRLYVPGYGHGVAADTGGAIKGERIDICYDTAQEAINWGRRAVTIYIIE